MTTRRARVSLALLFFALGVLALGPARAGDDDGDEPAPRAPAGAVPCRSDSRGDPLPPGAVGRLGSARFRGDGIGPLQNLAFLADGKSIVAFDPHSWGTTVLDEWDVATGKLLPGTKRLPDLGARNISPDGSVLALERGLGALVLWSRERGAEIATVTSDEVFLTTAFSAKGTTVACSGSSGIVRVFESATGKSRGTFLHGARVNALAVSPSGELVASAGSQGPRASGVQVFSLASQEKLCSFELDHEVGGLQFSSDGKRLLVGTGFSSELDAYEPRTGALVWKTDSRDDVHGVVVPPDGHTAFVSREGSLAELEIETGRELRRIQIQLFFQLRSLAVSPDGKLLGGVSKESVQLFDRSTLKPVGRPPLAWTPGALAFSPDGKLLAVGRQDILRGDVVTIFDVAKETVVDEVAIPSLGHAHAEPTTEETAALEKIRARSPETARLLERLRESAMNSTTVVSLALSADGGCIAIGVQDGTVRTYNRPRKTVTDVAAGRLLPDGVVVAEEGGRLLLRPFQASANLATVEASGEEDRSLVLSPDHRRLARLVGKEIVVSDLATGRALVKLPVPEHLPLRPLRLLFSPDGETLAVDDPNEECSRLFSLRATVAGLPGGEPRVLKGGALPGAFSPDGGALVTQHAGFSVASGSMLVDSPRLSSGESPVVFSPDGHLFAKAGVDGEVLLYDAAEATGRTPLVRTLERYVDASGRVDFAAWRRSPEDVAVLDSALAAWATLEPWRVWDEKRREAATVLNAANMLAVRAILDQETCEVRDGRVLGKGGVDLERAFKRTIAGRECSRADLESVLRKGAGHLVDCALADGTTGGGLLRPGLYSPEGLGEELDEQAKRFVADPRRVSLDPAGEVLRLSPLFRDRLEDFFGQEANVLAWVGGHSPDPTIGERIAKGKLRVEYFPLPSSLDEKKP